MTVPAGVGQETSVDTICRAEGAEPFVEASAFQDEDAAALDEALAAPANMVTAEFILEE